MPTCTSRPYAHPQDLPALIDFLRAVRPPAWISEYPSIVDLHEAMGRPSIQEKTQLWFDGRGRLAAFAFVLEPYNTLAFEISPTHESEMEGNLIHWAISCAASAQNPETEELDISSREDDLERIALLERQGFTRLPMSTLRLARDLKEPIPTSKLPASFNIRSVAGEQEVDALVALHRVAFGTSNMTREERLAIMRAPDYDPGLDLVIIAPNGRLAGYCTCSILAAENKLSGIAVGHIDPVAVHPDFQRRGLARALLLTGAQLLKERGMTLAMLGTSSENLPMQKAAEGAGFRVYSKRIWFSKTIPHA